jgi:hypothetical protein
MTILGSNVNDITLPDLVGVMAANRLPLLGVVGTEPVSVDTVVSIAKRAIRACTFGFRIASANIRMNWSSLASSGLFVI